MLDLGERILVDEGGFTVARARDGAEAIRFFNLRASEVRVLITDLDMPFVNGRQLVLALRNINPTLPVIIMSGAPMQREGEPDSFATEHLAKPFEARELLEMVHDALDRANSASVMPSKT